MEIRNVSNLQLNNKKGADALKKESSSVINTRDSFSKTGKEPQAMQEGNLKNLQSVLKTQGVKEKQTILFTTPISDVEENKARAFPAPEPVIGYDGSIYTATADGTLKAFDSKGNMKWETENEGSSYNTPSVGIDGTVALYGKGHKTIIALNPDGTKKSETKLPDSPYGKPEIDDKGNIYFRTENQLHKINGKGEIEWNRHIVKKAGFLLRPDGKILAPAGRGVACLNEAGETEWIYQPKGAIGASPAFGTDGKLMLVEDGRFKIIDKNGKTTAETPIEGEVRGDVLVDHKDNSYFGGDKLRAFGPDGKKLWEIDAGGHINRTPAMAGDGVIYAATGSEIFAVKDGKMLWKSPLSDGSCLSSLKASPGGVYADLDSRIAIFDKNGKDCGEFKSPGGKHKMGSIHPDGYMTVCDHKNLYALKNRTISEVAKDEARTTEETDAKEKDEKNLKIEVRGDWVIIGGVMIPRHRSPLSI